MRPDSYFETASCLSVPNRREITLLYEKLGQSEKNVLLKLRERFFECRGFDDTGKYCVLKKSFYPHVDIYTRIADLADVSEIPRELFNEIAFVFFAERTLQLYCERGIAKEIFCDTFSQTAQKIKQYYERKGIYGFDEFVWFAHHLRLNIFRLGSFCFQPFHANSLSQISINGISCNKNSVFVKIHIPDSADISYESRMRSYQAISEFLGMEKVVFFCDSWLLYPENEFLLDENSNIRSFLKDFRIIKSETFTQSESLAHIKNPSSSLARAYTRHIASGGRLGSGSGIMLFENGKIFKE